MAKKHKNTKHGMSKAVVYSSWIGMKTRCYNKNKNDYKNYGGRGIKVCNEWKDSFENFYEDIGKYWKEVKCTKKSYS